MRAPIHRIALRGAARIPRRRPGRLLVPALLLAAAIAPAGAFRIDPGPRELSAEELAIEADPESGIQHGVILLEETERDDPLSGYAKTSFHLRAKILSGEARSLGEIELPHDARTGYLRRWWGRTICPDGTVKELAKKDLHRETVVESRGIRIETLRGALPGVEPGCVIDYGWVIQDHSWRTYRRIPLQRQWPIRKLRYNWLPARGLASQYVIRRSPDLEVIAGDRKDAGGDAPGEGPRVRVSRGRDNVLIEGWDLPAFEEEPWGPPEDLLRASVILHYIRLGNGSTYETYWEDHSRLTENRVREFLFRDKGLEEAIASMELDPGAFLSEKLRGVHDWMAVNMRNLSALTLEEREAEADAEHEGKDRFTARQVLERREGTGLELDFLFIGFARALGAEAAVVLAPDRTEGLWDPGLLARGQLSERAIGVRDPTDPDGRLTFTDPCSGLPYGQVPWWLAPTKAMLTGKDGFQVVVIPGSDARENVLHSQVAIGWSDEGRATVSWSSVGGGQRGFLRRRALRIESPEERREQIESLCGAGPGFEVVEASAPALDELHAGFQIRCEGLLTDVHADEFEHEVELSLEGSWFPPLPAFTAEERTHPVEFHFPFVDMTVVDIELPEGFEAGPLPPAVKITRPYSSYALSVWITETGLRLQRAVGVVGTTVTTDDYAELRGFLQEVEKADRTRLVLLRQEDER